MPNDNNSALATVENRIATVGDESLATTEDYKGVAAYVSFVWAKTQNDDLKAAIAAQGGQLPTFVMTKSGFAQPIKPFSFHMLKAVTIATQMDENGKIVDAEAKMPEGGKDNKWAEHTFAVVVVVQDGVLTPAVVSLRSGARKALTNAVNFTDGAGVAGWERKGKLFAEAAAATESLAGRVTSLGSCIPEKSPTTGRMMLTGRCSPRPSTKVEAERFQAALEDPRFLADVDATFRAFDWKLKGLLSKKMDEAADE